MMIAGCASSSVTAVGGTKLATMTLEGNPYALGDDPSLLRIDNDDFIVTRTISETELRVERYNRSLATVWSTPVTFPDAHSHVRFMLFSFGVDKIPGEVPIKLFRRNKEIVMISYRYGDNDTLFALGRTFDIATGKLNQMKMLDTVPDQSQVDRPYRYYAASLAPDSGRIVLYAYGSGRGRNDYYFRIASVSTDLATVSARSVNVPDFHQINELRSMRIDPSGMIYLVSLADDDEPDTVRIARYDSRTGVLGPPLNKVITVTGNDDAEIHGVATLFSDDNDLMLLFPLRDDEDLLGTAVMKYDVAKDRFDEPKITLLTEENLEKLVDDDEYEDGVMHTIFRTPNPKAHYIICFEREHFSESTDMKGNRSYSFLTADALIMAFDASGAPTWQQALRKSSGKTSAGFQLITMAPSITDHGALRILYRDDSKIIKQDFSLEDGKEIKTEFKDLLEVGGAAFNVGTFTTWLDDQTAILLLRQGLWGVDWNLTRLDVPKE
jgi:hypothetical protein